MARKKMYRVGDYIETFDELEEIFKVSNFIMLDCGDRGEPRWLPKHKGFIVSMMYHVVRNRLASKKLAVAIKN